MSLRFFCGGIKTRTLDDQLGADRFPRNMLSLFFGINGNFFAVNDKRIFSKIDAPRERSVVRIMLKQVGQYLRGGEVVDGDDL